MNTETKLLRAYKFEEIVFKMLESLKTKDSSVEYESILIDTADSFSRNFPESTFSVFQVDEFLDSFLVFITHEDFKVVAKAFEELSKKMMEAFSASWSGAELAHDVVFGRYTSKSLSSIGAYEEKEYLIFLTLSFEYESRPMKISLIVPYDLAHGLDKLSSL